MSLTMSHPQQNATPPSARDTTLSAELPLAQKLTQLHAFERLAQKVPCPRVCCSLDKVLALLALGYTGALQWFGPIQPYLGAFGVVLLAWALRVRLRGEVACPVPSP